MSDFSVEDILDALPERYVLDQVLEKGGFGQVVKCVSKDSGQAVAVKLPFHKQDTKDEIALLQELMEERMDQRNIVRFIEAFDTRLGRAMVFELLDMSLVGFVNKYDPLPLSDIFSIVQQVATALDVLKERSLVHSDLKMDNVMVVNQSQRPPQVKLIDFGMTMPASETNKYLTIHLAMYRPPEVILDSGWNEGLDVWCLGVIMSQMWLGFNMFPNVEYEALRVMHKLLGPPPEHILFTGRNTINFYDLGPNGWDLKAREDVKDCVKGEREEDYSKSFTSLRDLVMKAVEDKMNTEPALDLLRKMLDMDKNERITPKQILQHPAMCYEKREALEDNQNSADSEEEDEHKPLSCLEIDDILPEEYVVTNMLALGKFGQFVKCENVNKFVTIKVPYSNNRTQREVRLLQKILDAGMDRRNIVKFIDSIQTSHGTMLVMEKLDVNLSAYMDKYHPLPLGHIQTIVKQTATALQALESKSLIHTGVTAENIFICSLFAQSPRIKLADFGSAIRTKKAEAGMRVQQLAYRAPEILLGLPFDQAIDVWSLGCTLVQMLTGIQLFCNESENKNMETMVKLLGRPSCWDLDKGLRTKEFFKRVGAAWELKISEELDDFPNFRSVLTDLYLERYPSETELVPYHVKNPKELTECLDLAEDMLLIDGIERTTPTDILKHPFILWNSENDNAELVPVKKAPVISAKVKVKVIDSQRKRSREKARKTFDVIQQKDRRSKSHRAEFQEAPVTCSGVILVKPAPPENIIKLQAGDYVQWESPRVLMSREKAHRTFTVTQQKDRHSKSHKAEVQEAPASSHRVIMVKPAPPENTIHFLEVDDVQRESVTSVELQSTERSSQRDPIQDQQQRDPIQDQQQRDPIQDQQQRDPIQDQQQRDPIQDQQQSPLHTETKAEDREPTPIQTPTSTRCDTVDQQLKDRPKRKLWKKRTAKVQPMNDSTLPPTEDDFVPKKKTKNIFRRAFSWLKRCSCFS